METKHPRIHWLIHVVIFTLIFAFLFVQVSYIMRHISATAHRNMVGFTHEGAPVDVLFVGGSSTYVYWIPMLAYHDYGFTSYNYSGDSMSPALMKNLIIESRKSQTAKLYMIDLRALEIMQYDPTFFSEEYIRDFTDGVPYSRNRQEMIDYALKMNNIVPKNMASMTADLILYHGNWRMLVQESFNYFDPEYLNGGKGFHFLNSPPETVTLTDYSNVTAECQLSPEVEQTMRDLLDYLSSEGLNAMFYVNPFSYQHDGIKPLFNTLAKIIDEYGYTFVNANDHYDELVMDPERDFYNVNHVNYLGAYKVTDYWGRYLTEHFDLPDHRGDEDYADWDSEYEDFATFAEDFDTEYRTTYGLLLEDSDE